MPERKYPDLAHLPPAEYRKEAEKRRGKERAAQNKQVYDTKRDQILIQKRQQRIAAQVEAARRKLERLEELAADPQKIVLQYNNDRGTVESV